MVNVLEQRIVFIAHFRRGVGAIQKFSQNFVVKHQTHTSNYQPTLANIPKLAGTMSETPLTNLIVQRLEEITGASHDIALSTLQRNEMDLMASIQFLQQSNPSIPNATAPHHPASNQPLKQTTNTHRLPKTPTSSQLSAYTQELTDLEIMLLKSKFEFMSDNNATISLSRIPALFKEVTSRELQRGVKNNAKKGQGYFVKELLVRVGVVGKDGWYLTQHNLVHGNDSDAADILVTGGSNQSQFKAKNIIDNSNSKNNHLNTSSSITKSNIKESKKKENCKNERALTAYTQPLSDETISDLKVEFTRMYLQNEKIHLPQIPKIFKEVTGLELMKGIKKKNGKEGFLGE